MLKIARRLLENWAVKSQTRKMTMDVWLVSPPAAGKERIMRVCALIVCLLAIPRLAMAEDFSWQAHLGMSSEKFQTELKKFSSCDYIKPLLFEARDSYIPNERITIKDWYYSRGRYDLTNRYGWLIEEGKLQSSTISELNCSADMRVYINTLIFENVVFDITITYDRCDRRDSSCDPLVPTKIDKSFESKL